MILQKLVQTSALALIMIGGAACSSGSSGSSGSSSTGTVTPPTTPVADTTAPSVIFTAGNLNVNSGGTTTVSVNASDSVGVTTGPTVSCTNGGSVSGTIFTAPVVTQDTTVVCTVTAGDAAGNTDTSDLTFSIIAPTPDATAPTVSFSPAALAVASGQTGTSALTATDNVGIASGPTFVCTNGGSFSGTVFTAPVVTQNTTVVCTATVSDAAGNSNAADLTVTVSAPVPDTVAPSLSFNPAVLTVASGQTGTSTLTATDNAGIASGPTFVCTNGGSFTGTTFTAPTVTQNTTVVCTATASDAAGNSSTADLTVTVTPPPAAVTISGTITFDHVPFNEISFTGGFNQSDGGLNFNAITQDPVPGVTVEAINGANTVLASTTSDGNGDYSLSVDPETNVRIRVKAEMLNDNGAEWDVRVVDNTSNRAPYAFQGSLASSGTTDSIRDLNAASGWGGTSYTGTRVAAPFAILAPIYESIQRVIAVDPDVVFPPAVFNWSVNNTPSEGNVNLPFATNIAAGNISTSSYIGNGEILILGDDDNDTDEYDDHVVIHEWGHYFEDQLSRSDSIGGPHGLGDILDPRVALSEGFGNALSGMMTDDPVYRDSFGARQGPGFGFDVEVNANANPGWYSEGSTQSILYDIFDSDDDAGDTLSAGLGPIYEVLVSGAYTGNTYLTTIFTFLEQYRLMNAGDISAINALAQEQSISITDQTGAAETNSGGVSTAFPIYKTITVNGPDVEHCILTDAGTQNKLGNRIYLAFDVASPGLHSFRMTRTSGAVSTDPDFLIRRNGTLVGIGQSGSPSIELATANLTTTGQHIIDASDFNGGEACFDFRITR